MSRSAPIGERLDWADQVCARAIQNGSGLSDAAVDFVMGLADRLDRYGARTTLSPKQLEWLGDIERKLDPRDEPEGRLG